jgi:membrane protein
VIRPAKAAADAVATMRARLPFTSRVTEQLLHVGILDRGTRIAAQLFLSVLPALFVFAAFAPAALREQLLSSLREEVGLRGEALHEVQQVIYSGTGETRDTFGVLGVVVTLLSATACSRALQRVCEISWRLRRAHARVAALRWFLWLAVWTATLVVQGPFFNAFGGGPVLGFPLSLAASTLLWWWTQHLLLIGRVPWLPLLPGALLCGLAGVGFSWAARLYLPGALDRSVAQFGPYGAVFTLLSWLILRCAGLSTAIALGYVIATEKPVAQWLGTPLSGRRQTPTE